jgi:uncharacterized protein (TIGR03000 family)
MLQKAFSILCPPLLVLTGLLGLAGPGAAQDANSAKSDPAEGVVYIDVQVPANAEVWFESQKMSQTGTSRRFVSPPIPAGTTHAYSIRARWTEDGQEVEKTRRVLIQAGDYLSVAMDSKLSSSDSTAAGGPRRPQTGDKQPMITSGGGDTTPAVTGVTAAGAAIFPQNNAGVVGAGVGTGVGIIPRNDLDPRTGQVPAGRNNTAPGLGVGVVPGVGVFPRNDLDPRTGQVPNRNNQNFNPRSSDLSQQGTNNNTTGTPGTTGTTAPNQRTSPTGTGARPSGGRP